MLKLSAIDNPISRPSLTVRLRTLKAQNRGKATGERSLKVGTCYAISIELPVFLCSTRIDLARGRE